VLLGTAAGLVALELALRGYLAAEAVRKDAEWSSIGAPPGLETEATLGQIVRPHAERRISYELIPDMSVTFQGVPVRTNEHGFRGPPCPAPGPRAPDTVRILGLGDSVMFGWGVEYPESFMGVLSRDLVAAHPGVTFDVINTAVPGYNTVMEIETLKVKGLTYRPDIVLIDFVENDLLPPHFIPRDVRLWTSSRCFLLDLTRAVLRGERFDPFTRFGEPPRLAADPREFWETLEFDPEEVPDGLRDMVGLRSFQAAMSELATLAASQGFEVVVTAHQEAPAYLRETCNELGFPLVEPTAVLGFMQAHGIDDRRGTVLTLSADDPHPSPLAHRLQAQGILEFLTAAGYVERALERQATER
jgi:hypothetical protein